MPSVWDRIYAASPEWLQNIGINVYGMIWRNRRYGGEYQDLLAEFVAREKFTEQDWEHYQEQRLRQLLLQAYQQVPYYREVFDSCSIDMDAIRSFTLRDLPQLPFFEKEMLRRKPEQLLALNYSRKRLHNYYTSGTTGTPLTIKFTTNMHRALTAAYTARVLYWSGVNPSMSRAMIGGRLVVPKDNNRPPFWRYNQAERQLYLSAFHISPHNARHYVDALNEYRPDYLVGYASAHFFLARMINEQALNVHSPRAVLTSSENLTADMRQEIERAYSCEVFDAYSGVEACVFVSECEHHQMHISPDVGIIELVDEEGKPVQPGQVGEIVATGLLNFAQPLIRYKTGDLAILSKDPCPCGRHMSVLKELVGRLEDTVVGRDGREMVRFHGIFIGLPSVREGQIIQETVTSFRLRLVIEPGFSQNDQMVIQKRFEDRLGPVDLTFEFVDQIERTHRGKFRAVISHVQRSSNYASSN